MAFWNFLSGKGTVRVPLTPEEAREQGMKFVYRRVWECSCGAILRIRAKDSRREGPSNYEPFPENHPRAGHSQILSSQLTWNGLAEERGWLTDPIKCPACRLGMSRAEFKEAKREGAL